MGSSEYLLSSATATHLISDFLRGEKNVDNFKRIQNLWCLGFCLIHKFNNYPSLSSEYLLSFASATYMSSDILREKKIVLRKNRKSLNIFLIHKFKTCPSLSSECILSSARVFKRHTVYQWDLKKKKLLI